MSHQEKFCILLGQILLESKKIYLCPVCHISYSDASALFKHCRDKGKQNPEDLLHTNIGAVNQKGGFGSFLSSLGIAIGWEDISAADLPLRLDRRGRREYGACLKFQFIIDGQTRSDPLDMEKKLTIMNKIAKRMKLPPFCHFVCLLHVAFFAGSIDTELATFLSLYGPRKLRMLLVVLYLDRVLSHGRCVLRV